MNNVPKIPTGPQDYNRINVVFFAFRYLLKNLNILFPLFLLNITFIILFNKIGISLGLGVENFSDLVDVKDFATLLAIIPPVKFLFILLSALVQVLLNIVTMVFINLLVNTKTSMEEVDSIDQCKDVSVSLGTKDFFSILKDLFTSNRTYLITLKAVLYTLALSIIFGVIAFIFALFNTSLGLVFFQLCALVIPILTIALVTQQPGSFGEFLADFKGLFSKTGGQLFNVIVFVILLLVLSGTLTLLFIAGITNIFSALGMMGVANAVNPYVAVLITGLLSYINILACYFLAYFYFRKIELINDKK